MLRIFKTIDDVTREIEEMEDGAWVYIVNPTLEELETVRLRYNVDESHMKAALDEEESPRIDVEDESTLFIIDVPVQQDDPSGRLYGTIPIGIIIAKEAIISICIKDVKILTDLIKGRMKGFYTYKKTRIILQIMYKVATYFLLYLKQIDRVSVQVERELHKSMKNKELIQLLSLEKSLVYFTCSNTNINNIRLIIKYFIKISNHLSKLCNVTYLAISLILSNSSCFAKVSLKPAISFLKSSESS